VATAAFLGVGLVCLVQGLFVGDWFAFFRAHVGYKTDPMAYSPEFQPGAVLIHSARILLGNWATAGERIPPASILFVAAAAVLLIAFSWHAARRSPAVSLQVIFLVVFLLAILSSGEVSQTRKEAILLPAVPLSQNLPAWILGVIVLVAFAFQLLLGTLFQKSILI